MNYQLQQDLYYKALEMKFQESHNNEQLKEVGLDNESWIKVIQEIQSAAITKKNSELRDIALDPQSDKNSSNPVSTFYVIYQYLTSTTCSTSDQLFILLPVIYRVINQLYDERNLLHTSMNQKLKRHR